MTQSGVCCMEGGTDHIEEEEEAGIGIASQEHSQPHATDTHTQYQAA